MAPLKKADANPIYTEMTLLTAKLVLGGAWRGSAPGDVAAVIKRMRSSCLKNVALFSDRQPKKLRVDDQRGSYPAIWLHAGDPTTAWVTLVVGTRDWCNLAYQFGHELGHVLCNSWAQDAKPRNPCQWIEEALVEAFSLRGLLLLADDWMSTPPFPNDGAYSGFIRSYRDTILAGYRQVALEQGIGGGLGAWFRDRKDRLDEHGGLDEARGAVPTMLEILENNPTMISDMGALNCWPERSGIPLHDYLDFWEKSCLKLHAPGLLPAKLRAVLTES